MGSGNHAFVSTRLYSQSDVVPLQFSSPRFCSPFFWAGSWVSFRRDAIHARSFVGCFTLNQARDCGLCQCLPRQVKTLTDQSAIEAIDDAKERRKLQIALTAELASSAFFFPQGCSTLGCSFNLCLVVHSTLLCCSSILWFDGRCLLNIIYFRAQ